MTEILMEKIDRCIQDSANEIISLGEKIYGFPETGFKEFKTSKIVVEYLTSLGLPSILPKEIPGVKCTLDTGRPGPSVALVAELDAVLCPDHMDKDQSTGAVHACGHHAQVASMLGTAKALVNSGAVQKLCGKIHFIAVPAEEFIELDYRMKLRDKGIIGFLGGKQELLRLGFFNDCQLAFMLHVRPGNKTFYLLEGTNGFIVKKIRYIGKAAHTGSPWEGINTLNAANIGITALNAIRETFRDDNMIRISPVMTESSKGLNVISSNTVLESYIRAKSLDIAIEAGKSFERAMLAGAVATGAKLEICDIPGYLPFNKSDDFIALSVDVMEKLVDNRSDIEFLGHSAGSTDMGDLSCLMPSLHAYIGGAVGSYHNATFNITDKNMVFIMGTRFMTKMIIALLEKSGSAAKEIVSNYRPLFSSIDHYCKVLEKTFCTRHWDANNHIFKMVDGELA